MKVSVMVAMAALGISMAGGACNSEDPPPGTGGKGGSTSAGGRGGSGTGGGGTPGNMAGAGGGGGGTLPFPTDELVLLLQFEEGTGTTLKDTSGKGNDGIIVSGPTRTMQPYANPTWGAGKHGKGYEFTGQDWGIIKYSDSLKEITANDETTGMSFGAWVKFKAATSGDMTNGVVRVIQQQKGTLGTEWFGMGLRDGAPSVTIDFWFKEAPAPIVLDEWTHILGSFDGSILTLYVNGVPVAMDSANVVLSVDQNPFTIGAAENMNGVIKEFMKGSVDDVVVYSRPLSQDEVLAVMAGKK